MGDADVLKEAGGVVSNNKIRLFLSRRTDTVGGLVSRSLWAWWRSCWTPRRVIGPEHRSA
jgi:hypothetical protein